jgi:hypothetical protein
MVFSVFSFLPSAAQSQPVDADYQRGLTFYNQSQFDEAISVTKGIVQSNPNYWQAYVLMGYAYARERKFQEAYDACQMSLKINPNNPTVQNFMSTSLLPLLPKPQNQTVTPNLIVSDKPLPSKPQAELNKTFQVKYDLSKNWWIKVYGGYDYSVFGDLINGVKAWNPIVVSPEKLTTSTSNSGVVAGLEFGRKLGEDFAFSISLENISSGSESYQLSDSSGDVQRESFSPELMSASLNLYFYPFRAKGARTYLMVGGGYYHALVSYTGYDTSVLGSPDSSATFTGDVLGGSLGIGQFLAIGDSFGLEVFAKARLATFSQVTSSTLATGGSVTNANGPYTIGVNTGFGNTIGIWATQLLSGNGGRYAVVDYSGIDAAFSFGFYF